MPHEIRLSLLVSTRNRAPVLPQFLTRLNAALQEEPEAEALLVDNGSTDATAEVLEAWASQGPRRRFLRAPGPGKSRALNTAASQARGWVLAFTDDDVILPHGWLKALGEFFPRRPDFSAATGPIRLPPETGAHDLPPDVEQAWQLVLSLFDCGTQFAEIDYFYGANLGIRREAFEKAGGLCELLGPGASGFYDDLELAWRLRKQNFRIGYDPHLVVYHAPDPGRLTAHGLWARARSLAASERIVRKPPSCLVSAVRCLEALGAVLGASIRRNRTHRLRASFRGLRYVAHLGIASGLLHPPQSAGAQSRCCRNHASHLPEGT